MTLQEAMATGLAFKRPSMGRFYLSFAVMALDENIGMPSEELLALRATDYVVTPSTIEGIDADILAEAWNAALPRSGSVARAATSTFFAQFKRELLALAAQNVG